MIFKTRTIKQYEEETSNIIECEQKDNIQREGVQSIYDEKKLLERKGIGIYQKKIRPEDINEEDVTEVGTYKENLDIIDEQRAELKQIENNKKEYNKMKQNTEKMINDIKENIKETAKGGSQES